MCFASARLQWILFPFQSHCHITLPIQFLWNPPFAIKLGLGGWNVLVGLNRLYLIPQPIFGRKEGLLKFSLCTECFTVQCYNLMANNSRHKIYFPCCVSNLVAVISISMHQCEAPLNRTNDAETLGRVRLKLIRIMVEFLAVPTSVSAFRCLCFKKTIWSFFRIEICPFY